MECDAVHGKPTIDIRPLHKKGVRDWTGLGSTEMDWNQMKWIGLDWTGLEWNGTSIGGRFSREGRGGHCTRARARARRRWRSRADDDERSTAPRRREIRDNAVARRRASRSVSPPEQL